MGWLWQSLWGEAGIMERGAALLPDFHHHRHHHDLHHFLCHCLLLQSALEVVENLHLEDLETLIRGLETLQDLGTHLNHQVVDQGWLGDRHQWTCNPLHQAAMEDSSHRMPNFDDFLTECLVFLSSYRMPNSWLSLKVKFCRAFERS